LENVREQLKDTKQDLRDLRSESKDDVRKLQGDLDQARTDLAAARNELASAKSSYDALQVTKGSELETRIAQVKMEAMEEARKEERDRLAAEAKKPVEDPFDAMMKRVEQAKSLTASLGEKFGINSGGDDTPAKPTGRLDQLMDVAIKVGGSPEIRKLAGTVTKSVAEGAASVLKAREESKQPAASPSTAALTEAWQSGQRPQPAVQAEPNPEPQADLDTPDQKAIEPDVADSLEAIADAIPDMEQIQAQAGEMLDDIENHSMLGTPVEEAAEEMIGKLMGLLDRPREDILEGMPDATAAKTLEELEFPLSRISPNALEYMDKLIQYGAAQHAAAQQK